ncbi:unnamed protein product [Ixodes pacificus]
MGRKGITNKLVLHICPGTGYDGFIGKCGSLHAVFPSCLLVLLTVSDFSSLAAKGASTLLQGPTLTKAQLVQLPHGATTERISTVMFYSRTGRVRAVKVHRLALFSLALLTTWL